MTSMKKLDSCFFCKSKRHGNKSEDGRFQSTLQNKVPNTDESSTLLTQAQQKLYERQIARLDSSLSFQRVTKMFWKLAMCVSF